MANDNQEWFYLDSTGSEYGPFPASTMRDWFAQGFFPIGEELPVRLPAWSKHVLLRAVYPDISTAFIGPPRAVKMDGQELGPPSYTGGFTGGGGRQYSSDNPPRSGGRSRGRGGGGGGGRAAPPDDVPGFAPPQSWPPNGYWMMPGAGGCPAPTMPGYGFPPVGGGMPGGMGGMPGGMPGVPDMLGMRGGMPRGPPGPFGGVPPLFPAGGAGGMTGRYTGRIKSFNAKQGFGFIDCPEVHSMYGRDVFLHKAQIGDFKVGTEVVFNIEPNKQGMPQARDLVTIDGQQPGPSTAMPKGSGGCGGRGGKGGGGKSGGKGKKAGKNSQPSQDIATLTMGPA